MRRYKHTRELQRKGIEMKSNDKFITIMICIVLIMGIFVSSSSSVFAKSSGFSTSKTKSSPLSAILAFLIVLEGLKRNIPPTACISAYSKTAVFIDPRAVILLKTASPSLLINHPYPAPSV